MPVSRPEFNLRLREENGRSNKRNNIRKTSFICLKIWQLSGILQWNTLFLNYYGVRAGRFPDTPTSNAPEANRMAQYIMAAWMP